MLATRLDKIPLTLLEKTMNLLTIGHERMGFDSGRAIALPNIKKDATNA
jgi:hypothetical protein